MPPLVTPGVALRAVLKTVQLSLQPTPVFGVTLTLLITVVNRLEIQLLPRPSAVTIEHLLGIRRAPRRKVLVTILPTMIPLVVLVLNRVAVVVLLFPLPPTPLHRGYAKAPLGNLCLVNVHFYSPKLFLANPTTPFPRINAISGKWPVKVNLTVV